MFKIVSAPIFYSFWTVSPRTINRSRSPPSVSETIPDPTSAIKPRVLSPDARISARPLDPWDQPRSGLLRLRTERSGLGKGCRCRLCISATSFVAASLQHQREERGIFIAYPACSWNHPVCACCRRTTGRSSLPKCRTTNPCPKHRPRRQRSGVDSGCHLFDRLSMKQNQLDGFG